MDWKSTEYTGWGRVHSAKGELARPERGSAMARLAQDGPTIGQRRSYGDVCLNDAGRAIETSRLDRYLGFDPETGVLEVEAGCQIGQIAKDFAPRGWLPAVMPGTGFATVGGCIANDVHGKNHHGVGSFGQHVVSLVLHTADGPMRLTPEGNSRMFRATVGGLGQTGAIASAKLQLIATKGDVMMVTEQRMEGLDSFLDHLDHSTASYCVGWIDATAKGAALGRGILEEGETGAGLVPPAKRGRKVPMDAPGFALSAPIVRTFNGLYYGRVPKRGRTVVKPIDDFFFPLDKIHDWNRLYGKRGFHQFQCVVPMDARDTLRQMLEKIALAGLASPLAVLKRMGAGRGGMMSFPMEGYTLAVDFPNRAGAAQLVSTLTELAGKCGGRIYLAKDSVATAEQVTGMYTEQTDWLSEVERLDPEGALKTNLVRRLKLRSDT